MTHPTHEFHNGHWICWWCGGIEGTSETDGLCMGRQYDDCEDGDLERAKEIVDASE